MTLNILILQGKVGILSRYWTFFCGIAGVLILLQIISDYFIYLFVDFLWFTLLQLVWFFTEKNLDRRLFRVKCKYKSVTVTLFHFLPNSSPFFYCVTFIFTIQCNSRWNTSNQAEQKKKNQNWSILMSSQDITLLLCPVINSR